MSYRKVAAKKQSLDESAIESFINVMLLVLHLCAKPQAATQGCNLYYIILLISPSLDGSIFGINLILSAHILLSDIPATLQLNVCQRLNQKPYLFSHGVSGAVLMCAL